MKKRILVFMIIGFLCGKPVFSCTGFVVSSPEFVLVGTNEDYIISYTDTVVRVRPGSKGKYGCLLIGFKRQDFSMEGMNDQGLFFDMFTVPSFEWVHDPDKLDYEGFLERKMLEECADVEEAIAFYKSYNHPGMGSVFYQILVADKSGKAAAISWGVDDVEITRKDKDYFVITNFFLLHPERGHYPCWRYMTATEMIKSASEYSHALCRSVLENVHLDSNFSTVCSLKSGDMNVYNNHNFDEYIKFNIFDELAKGRYDYQLPGYFSEMRLLSPENGEQINTSSVTFEWEGKLTSGYELYYATDPDFKDCTPISAAKRNFLVISGFDGINYGILCLGLFILFLIIKNRKKMMIRFVVLVFLIFTVIFCQTSENDADSDGDSSDRIHSIAVSNLQPNQTYYWKVHASSSGNVISKSIVREFFTGD